MTIIITAVLLIIVISANLLCNRLIVCDKFVVD